MGTFFPGCSRRFSCGILISIGWTLLFTAGCGKGPGNPDESAMRASFQRKGPIDINTVPPNQRAIVQAYMNASKAGPPAKNAIKKP